jgi:hypothetical protein
MARSGLFTSAFVDGELCSYQLKGPELRPGL